ncbi:shikimate dehydrogenase [Maribacter algarum]|uniref:Shikimate dehydrogenase n=1 Tax=Maribacter algarum (ex Zhang et al. 2020) TaxID=2578118 RepID=A0A5S3PI16_9FLAO|nr:shikimate dehydrogenase [Maribacter algarum]TMM53918.1 shikimate dehydrogenase [Maribacter algarum]
MEKKEDKQFKFGLVGKDISYSFSRGYFAEKFKQLGLDNHSYVNFDLPNIEVFEGLLADHPEVKGLNVTIPYKESIIPFLTELDSNAEKIGAVNTIKVVKNGLIGYNTDFYGFQKSIEPFLQKHHKKALILGTGGASKAIAFVFEELDIAYKFVSRLPDENQLSYQDLDKAILEEFTILVNCTPLGTHPNVEQKPSIPYHYLKEEHLLFDLIYNPIKTAFLSNGESRGASICNGLRMLELQAEKAWEIWNQ